MSPSRASTSTTTSISKPSIELESNQHQPTPSSIPKPCTTHLNNTFTPTTHPQTHTLYLTVRLLSITIALLQITLVAIAASGAISPSTPRPTPTDRNPDGDPRRKLRHWLDPSLSPAISSFFWCAVDVLSVLRFKRRAHHIARAGYDGLLAVGFAIGAGFFIHMAYGVLNGSVEGTTGAEMGVGGGLVGCMVVMVILHYLVSVGGVRDTLETRRAIRLAR